VPSSDHDKRLRAELAAELGWFPADLDDESLARHRADAAALEKAFNIKTIRQLGSNKFFAVAAALVTLEEAG
jgi:hypothetical protein